MDYLLAPEKSRGKAGFFLSLGFRRNRWEIMAEALKAQDRSGRQTGVVVSPHGTRYRIQGEIDSPDGRSPRARVRTIWIEEPGSDQWRLITAHPA